MKHESHWSAHTPAAIGLGCWHLRVVAEFGSCGARHLVSDPDADVRGESEPACSRTRLRELSLARAATDEGCLESSGAVCTMSCANDSAGDGDRTALPGLAMPGHPELSAAGRKPNPLLHGLLSGPMKKSERTKNPGAIPGSSFYDSVLVAGGSDAYTGKYFESD